MSTAKPGLQADGGQQGTGFDQAYAELVESDRFQTQMSPYEPPPPPPEAPDWLQRIGEWLATLGPFWELVFWALAIGLAALLLFAIGRALYARFSEPRPAGDDDADTAQWRPEEGAARSLLAEADALAKAGRFAEAAHLLLFRSLEDIEDRLPDFLKPALTSRDIAAAPALPSPARSAFSAIAGIVERGLFAERPVDESGWTEARQAYERFAFGESWAGDAGR